MINCAHSKPLVRSHSTRSTRPVLLCQELDYVLECENGVRIAEEMRVLPMVVIPKNYPAFTSRRVHVAQWVWWHNKSNIIT